MSVGKNMAGFELKKNTSTVLRSAPIALYFGLSFFSVIVIYLYVFTCVEKGIVALGFGVGPCIRRPFVFVCAVPLPWDRGVGEVAVIGTVGGKFFKVVCLAMERRVEGVPAQREREK